jgi:hypothetical protein
VLIPHKFDVNVSNLVLMPKKSMVEVTTILFFFLNHVLRKTERTSGEPTGRTHNIFLYLYIRIIISFFYFRNEVTTDVYLAIEDWISF